jgi:nucleoside-diphosphate-sugar epimerase
MRILVTGASGFIGSNFIKFLLSKNFETYVLIRKDTDYFNVKYPGVNIIKGDLESISKEEIIDNKIEIVVHLAWENVSKVNLAAHNEHLLVQKNFIEMLLNCDLKKLIISGSCFEYGKINGEIDVTTNTLPATEYGIAKINLLNWLQSIWSEKYNRCSISWMRIFYVFGENQHERSLYSQLISAINNKNHEFDMSRGFQIRDFIHISDVIDCLHKEITSESNGFFIKNICSGSPISVREFVEKVLQDNNYSLKLNLGVYPIPDYEPIAFWGTDKLVLSINN